jgi:hypothetical protein
MEKNTEPGKTSWVFFLRTCYQFFGQKIIEFFVANPNTGSGILSTLDPGWKRIVIPDPQHWFFSLDVQCLNSDYFLQA